MNYCDLQQLSIIELAPVNPPYINIWSTVSVHSSSLITQQC